MANTTLRIPDELHEKLRWLAYTERRSLHNILLAIITEALKDVTVPEEVKPK